MQVYRVFTTGSALNDLEQSKNFYSKQSQELSEYFYDTLARLDQR